MIIGLSGVAKSGKDTVSDYLVQNHNYVKIALADPIKRFCMNVFNWDKELLWGPSEFRDITDDRYFEIKYWRDAYERLKKHSSAFLIDIGLSYSDHVQILYSTFQKCMWSTLGIQDVNLNNDVLLSEKPFNIRIALQEFGTTFGRQCRDTLWIDYTINIINKLLTGKGHYYQYIGFIDDNKAKPYSNIIISDIRFLNELLRIKLLPNTQLIRIKRSNGGLQSELSNHQSEKEQFSIPNSEFNFIINNDSTLNDLYNKIETIQLMH